MRETESYSIKYGQRSRLRLSKTKMNNELTKESVSKGSINKNLSTDKTKGTPLVEGLRVERNNFLLELFKSLHLGGCVCCVKERSQIAEDLSQGIMTLEDYERFGRKKYKECLCKNNLTMRQQYSAELKYFLKYNNDDEVAVSKDTFNKVKGKVVLYGEYTVKYVYPLKKTKSKNSRKSKNKNKNNIEFQGISEVFNKTRQVFKDMKSSYVGVSSAVSTSKQVWTSLLDSIKNTCARVPTLRRYVVLIRDIFTPLVSIFGLINSLNMINLVAIIGNIISIFKTVDEFDKREEKFKFDLYQEVENICPEVETELANDEVYEDAASYNLNTKFQTLEALFGAATVQMLPKWIQKTLSTFTTLSSTKLLDDNMMLAKFFRFLNVVIFTILGVLVKRGIMSNESFNKVEEFFDGTCLGRYTYYVLCMEKSVNAVTQNAQIINDVKFQEENMKLFKEFEEDRINSGSYVERNGAVKLIFEQFKAIIKLIKSNQDITRVEPICLIFEGKPKTGKSATMANLTDAFQKTNQSVYSHTTPNPKISKDFYDDYNNQDIFIMDDVGQQGNSQWCQIINLVSPIKYGLPCANAALKQTKYMTSSILLGTTNKLENLVFHKDDGVNEPEALFRRCDILSFNEVTMESDDKGFFRPTGRIVYKHYQLSQGNTGGAYVEGFEPNFAKFAQGLSHTFDYEGKDTSDQLNWILKIMAARLKYKRSEKKSLILDYDRVFKDISFQHFEVFDPTAVLRKYFMHNTFDLVYHSCCLMVSNLVAVVSDKVDDVKNYFKDNFVTIIMFIIGFTISTSMSSYLGKRILEETRGDLEIKSKIRLEGQLENIISKYSSKCELTTSDMALKKNMRYVKVIVDIPSEGRVAMLCCSLISGGCMLTNAHVLKSALEKTSFENIQDRVYAIVYSDLDKNMIMYDNVKLSSAYVNFTEDIIVWSLPKNIPSLLPDVTHLLELDNISSTKLKLVTPSGYIDVSNQITNKRFSITIPMANYNVSINNANSICYDFSLDGACGSILTNQRGKVVGFHIAGNDENGFARVWSLTIMKEISEVMRSIRSLRYNVTLGDVMGKEDCSIIKCENTNKWGGSVPTKTKIVPSNVCGFTPFTRLPVNLEQPNVIKDMAKKSYKCVAEVDVDALNFSRQYIKDLLPQFKKVTEKEVVLGTELSSCINKKTSSGFGFGKDKSQYLDYDNGQYTTTLREKINSIKKQVLDGSIDIENIMYVETLKDELRDAHKVDAPRCFKMSPLSLTCIGREYFLNLIDKLQESRYENGIMIGINPFSEWKNIYKLAARYDNNCVDGDYGKWDGSMLTQFQIMVAEELEAAFEGTNEDKLMVRFFLTTLINAVTLNMNEVLVCTHSMPSGCMLTAVFNCLINKAYGSYIYYRLMMKNDMKPTLTHFRVNFFSCVYGDDILMFIRNKLLEIMNGLTYASECELLGLTFTTADKTSALVKVKGIEDCQFLKRSFRFDAKLGYVCPLDIKSMEGTLNFVSQYDRVDELTQIKIFNFQREARLHGLEYYDNVIKNLTFYLVSNKLQYQLLSIGYIEDLYMMDKDAFAEGLMWDRSLN